MINLDAQRSAAEGARHITTRFGEFDVEPRDVIDFPDGLPGFEQCRRFVLLSSGALGPLQCLHALDGPPASFLAIDPRLVVPSYQCELAKGDYLKLQAEDGKPLLWLGLVTVGDGYLLSVNLRAPIVVNPARMIGCQVIPHDSAYPLRHGLFSVEDSTGAGLHPQT